MRTKEGVVEVRIQRKRKILYLVLPNILNISHMWLFKVK